MNNVGKEIKDLEKFIETKVEEKVKMASSNWGAMGTKQKMDFIFVGLGILAFSVNIWKTLKEIRGGGA
tara:strand:+ start:675 stop:878 length:204 start_codon:yes stop_codon:yes gene_type:complete